MLIAKGTIWLMMSLPVYASQEVQPVVIERHATEEGCVKLRDWLRSLLEPSRIHRLRFECVQAESAIIVSPTEIKTF